MFFDFEELDREELANEHQAEVSSQVTTEEQEAAKPAEEAAPYLSQDNFEEMSGMAPDTASAYLERSKAGLLAQENHDEELAGENLPRKTLKLGRLPKETQAARKEDQADSYQAEAPSPVITDELEAAKPVEDTAFHRSKGKFKEVRDQHYRRVKELKEQEQREAAPIKGTDNEARISHWYLLDNTPAPGDIPGSEDEARHEEANHTTTPVTQEDTGVTPESSDESDVSIYGLCRITHEVEKGDELSEPSSQDNGEMAQITKKRVQRWRQENTLTDDHDFSQLFVDYDEAYHNVGRVVADAWSKAKIREEPGIITDSARLRAVEATVAKVRRIDTMRRNSSNKRKKTTHPASSRQSGDEADARASSIDKSRFIEPLMQLMEALENYPIDRTAADEKTFTRHKRRAEQIIHESSIPTLHKAITTAAELRKFQEDMEHGPSTLGPKEIEGFLELSKAPARATEAILWMVEQLQLDLDGWKPDNLEPPPLEMQHIPAAEPFMIRAIEKAVQVGAESDDPIWLARLATLLQVNSGLRPSLILRSSVPVERHERWMLFFCKQGKRKHHRVGFYWGAISVTSNGYNWADRFLAAYSKRRNSEDGQEMMGMIFRTDTNTFISPKVVANLAMEAIREAGKDPGQLRPASWTKALPTLAAYLNFSHTERRSLSLSHVAEVGGDEESITSRYAEANKGLSKYCKTICAAALTILAHHDVQTLSNSTTNWKEIARRARLEARPEPLDEDATWKNPDIVKARVECKLRKSQRTFPRELNGILLYPESRQGEKYCADFQSGTCQEDDRPDDPCRSGSHRCAALFKSGRICHGRHEGSKCGYTRKHASLADLDDQGEPVRKATKTQIPAKPSAPCPKSMPKKASHATTNHTSMPDAPGYVTDDSIMRHMLAALKQKRWEVQGNRRYPEPPSLVAKVCWGAGKGELWLGAIPTAERMPVINETKHSIQIYCFKECPHHQQVTRDEYGISFQDALIFRCEMSNSKTRPKHMQELLPYVLNSLRQGDNAYCHCITGVSRGPRGAAAISAKLMGTTFEQALHLISQVRNIKSDGGEEQMEGCWADSILQQRDANIVAPTGFSCRAPITYGTTLHATTVVNGRALAICNGEAGATGEHDLEEDTITVESIESAACDIGGIFCATCKNLLKASLNLRVSKVYW